MTRTERMTLRVTTETVKRAELLASTWSPVKPLSQADVIEECVKRVHEQETKKQEKRR